MRSIYRRPFLLWFSVSLGCLVETPRHWAKRTVCEVADGRESSERAKDLHPPSEDGGFRTWHMNYHRLKTVVSGF